MTLDRERIETGARLAREAERRALSGRWRVGRKLGRTLYAVIGPEPSDEDWLLGLVDEPEVAAFIARCNPEFVLELVREVERRDAKIAALVAGCEAGLTHAEHLRMDTPEDEQIRLKLVETIRLALAFADGRFELDDALRAAEKRAEQAEAELERMREHYAPFVTIVAALAIYGEGASLPALVEKARALNEAGLKPRATEGGGE